MIAMIARHLATIACGAIRPQLNFLFWVDAVDSSSCRRWFTSSRCHARMPECRGVTVSIKWRRAADQQQIGGARLVAQKRPVSVARTTTCSTILRVSLYSSFCVRNDAMGV